MSSIFVVRKDVKRRKLIIYWNNIPLSQISENSKCKNNWSPLNVVGYFIFCPVSSIFLNSNSKFHYLRAFPLHFIFLNVKSEFPICIGDEHNYFS